MSELFHDPFLQSSLWPLLASALAVGMLGSIAGSRSTRLAAGGMGVAFVALYLLVIGLPALPPPASTGKLFWVAVAGVLLGLIWDGLHLGDRLGRLLLALWMVVSLGWIAVPLISAGNAMPVVGLMLVIGLIPALLPAGTGQAGRSTLAYGALGLGAGVAVGGTALIGSSASIAQLGLGLGAIAGGFLLWNWPRARHVWALSGRVALGLPILLASVLILFSRAQTASLLLALLAVPVAVAAASRVKPASEARGWVGPALQGAVITAAVLVLPVVSVLLAWLLSGDAASPY